MERRWRAVCGIVASFSLVAQYLMLRRYLVTNPFATEKVEPCARSSPTGCQWGRIKDSSRAVESAAFSKSAGVNFPSLTKEEREELELRLKRASVKTKYILHWYNVNSTNAKEWPSETCGKCAFTTNRSMIHHPDTGAVVFYYNKIDSDTLPQGPRRNDQLHVWYTGEAPSSLYNMRRRNLSLEDKYKFNLTRTYRRDSGIYHPYGRVEEILKSKLERDKQPDLRQILRNKTKIAVAVVTNCMSTVGARIRLKLIQRMRVLGLDIDTFGRCFGNRIKETNQAFADFLTKYKFYLAFENSYHCRDYITEKFFNNGLRAGTVPVVLGATKEDYLAVAPQGSFVFAEDFSSIASLVDYLNYLDKNDDEYLGYFSWIGRGVESLPMRGINGRYCRLCRQVHGINVDDIYYRQYNSATRGPLFSDYIVERKVPGLRTWYYGTENELCFERSVRRILQVMNFSDFTLQTKLGRNQNISEDKQ